MTEVWSVVGGVYFALQNSLVPDELDDAVYVGIPNGVHVVPSEGSMLWELSSDMPRR